MNVKNKMKYTVAALSLCLLTATGQAGIVKGSGARNTFRAAGRVASGEVQAATTVKLPKTGVKVTIPGQSQGANILHTLSQKIRGGMQNAKDWVNYRAMRRELQQNIEAGLITEEDVRMAVSTPIIASGPKETVIGAPSSYRDIHLPSNPAPLPNGMRWQNISNMFDGSRSLNFLERGIFHTPSFVSSKYVQDFGNIVIETYIAMAKGQIEEWILNKAIIGPLQEFVAKANLTPEEAPLFFLRERAINMPEWIPLSWTISFTEFQVKQNGGNFPTFGYLDADLNYMVIGLWHRLLTESLTPSIKQFLLDDFLYAADAQDIESVLDEAVAFFQANGRWPGVQTFALSKEKALEFIEGANAGEILTQKIVDEMELGQKTILLTYTLPDSPYWDGLSGTVKRLIPEIKQSIEQEVAQYRAD